MMLLMGAIRAPALIRIIGVRQDHQIIALMETTEGLAFPEILPRGLWRCYFIRFTAFLYFFSYGNTERINQESMES